MNAPGSAVPMLETVGLVKRFGGLAATDGVSLVVRRDLPSGPTSSAHT